MKLILPIILSLFIITTIPGIYAESVPDWVKNTAGWWATDAISEKEFVNAIEFLANDGIIIVESTNSSKSSESVPDWVKNTAGWWETDAISEKEFVNAIEFLANDGIISVKPILSLQQEIEILFNESVYRIPENESYAKINSYGFRGVEITKDKPTDTLRIFAVGGSTTFSVGVEDDFTWPVYLEKKINKFNPKSNVQVINAGISSATSHQNSKLIEQKLIQFKPDLIIMYEGVNDQGCLMPPFHNKNTISTEESIIQACGVFALQDYPKYLAERYSNICNFAKQNDFDIIVIFQPNVNLDDKVLTTQELDSYFDRPQQPILLEDYDTMVSNTLSNIQGCYATADLRQLFTSYNIPIYPDKHHLGKVGNEILAENIQNVIMPWLLNKGIFENETNEMNVLKNPFVFPDMTNTNFSNKIIENESFFGYDLSESDFSNSKLIEVDLRLSNLEGVNFTNSELLDVKLRQNILKNADFTNVDFTNVDLANIDLSYTDLSDTNLANKDLRRTFFHESDLNGADLSNSNLENSFLHGVDFTNANLSNAILVSVDFTMIKNKDLRTTNIFGTSMGFSDLRQVMMPDNIIMTNFHMANMVDIDFSERKIVGGIFEHTNMQNADLEGSDFSSEIVNSILYDFGQYPPAGIPENEISNHIKSKLSLFPIINSLTVESRGNNLHVTYSMYNHMLEADLSNANLSNANFTYADLSNANLTYADLSNANLKDVYFLNANLEGANLEGANLEGANLEGANLEGANLEGANLKCINHEICNS